MTAAVLVPLTTSPPRVAMVVFHFTPDRRRQRQWESYPINACGSQERVFFYAAVFPSKGMPRIVGDS